MKYQVQEFELELNSKDFPQLTLQQFEQMANKQTDDFIGSMVKVNAQFIALQDLTALGVPTKFFFVAGCAAIRRVHQLDAPTNNLYVRLEAHAVIEVAEEDQLLPGEKPLNTEVGQSPAVVA